MFISADNIAEKTARDVYRRSLQKKVHMVSGFKAKGEVQTESRHEANIFFLAHLDPRVVHIRAQPCTFDLETGKSYKTKTEAKASIKKTGKNHSVYTPDFQFTLRNSTIVYVEGKPDRQSPDAVDILQIQQRLSSFGHRLLVVRSNLFTKDFEANVRLLRKCADLDLQPDVREWLTANSGSTFYFEDCVHDGVSQNDILIAIATGKVKADLRGRKFSRSTRLEIVETTSHLEILAL